MTSSRAYFGAITAIAVLVLSGCSMFNSEEDPVREPVYDSDLFRGVDLCAELNQQIPSMILIEDDDSGQGGGGDDGCSVARYSETEFRGVFTWVINSNMEYWEGFVTQEFDQYTGEKRIPLEGLGEEAAIIVNPEERLRSSGLALWIRDANLLMEFYAPNEVRIGGSEYPALPLHLNFDAAVEVAERYLDFAGSENHTVVTEPMPEGEFTTALDLCAEFEAQGFQLAADANDWTEKFPSMDRCHWENSETEGDFWLFAEAVGPLGAAELPADEFAQWWLGGLPVSEGDDLGLVGDESYVHHRDPDKSKYDDIEVQGADLAFRIGNLLFQGRYEGEGDTEAIAQDLLEQLGAQAEALLARS